jgi:hypothetical protein
MNVIVKLIAFRYRICITQKNDQIFDSFPLSIYSLLFILIKLHNIYKVCRSSSMLTLFFSWWAHFLTEIEKKHTIKMFCLLTFMNQFQRSLKIDLIKLSLMILNNGLFLLFHENLVSLWKVHTYPCYLLDRLWEYFQYVKLKFRWNFFLIAKKIINILKKKISCFRFG